MHICMHVFYTHVICRGKKKGKKKSQAASWLCLTPTPLFSQRCTLALELWPGMHGPGSYFQCCIFSFKAFQFFLELPRNSPHTDSPLSPRPPQAVPWGTGKSWSFEKAPLGPEPDLKEVAWEQGVERGRHHEIHQTLPQTRVNSDTLWPGFYPCVELPHPRVLSLSQRWPGLASRRTSGHGSTWGHHLSSSVST